MVDKKIPAPGKNKPKPGPGPKRPNPKGDPKRDKREERFKRDEMYKRERRMDRSPKPPVDPKKQEKFKEVKSVGKAVGKLAAGVQKYKYMNVMGPAGPAPKRSPRGPVDYTNMQKSGPAPKPTPKPKSPVSGKGYSKPVMPRRGGR